MRWPDLTKKTFAMLWHLRHWLQYWRMRTWIYDNLCYLTINCDTGQHSHYCDVWVIHCIQLNFSGYITMDKKFWLYSQELVKRYKSNAISNWIPVRQWQNWFFLQSLDYCRKLALRWGRSNLEQISHWRAVHVFWCPPYMDHLRADLKKWGKLMVVIFPVFSTDFPPN